MGADLRTYWQRIAWDIYRGDFEWYVKDEMRKRLKRAESLQKFLPYVAPRHNLVRRIAEVLAVVYRRPPRRYSTPAKAVDILRKYAPNIDLTLEKISKLTFALGDVIAFPYYDENDDQIKIDIIPPHYVVDIEYSRSSLKSITIEQEIGDVKYFFDGTYEIYERQKFGDPKKIDQGDTGLGRLPLVIFSLEPRDYLEPWGIYANKDIIQGTIEISILEAYHGYTSFLRSFRLPTISQEELATAGRSNPPEIEIGPDTVLNYKLDPVELADPADQFWQSILKQVEDLAASRDISPTTIFRSVSKLDEVKAASEELRNRWESQVKIFRIFEGQLLDIIFLLLKKFGLYANSMPTWRIDYMLPSPILSDPRQNLEVLDKGIRLGVDSPSSFLLRENPDVRSEREAWEIINKNINDRAQLVEKMRKLNMPADPEKVGSDPEYNGAAGPPAAPTNLTKMELDDAEKEE